MGRHVLVTGGAGMIGSNLVKKLLDQGDNVMVIDNLSRGRRENVDSRAELLIHDITNPVWPSRVYSCHFDQIYHLAAVIGGVGKMINMQFDSMVNAVIDRNVFTLAVEKRTRLLYCSTACVYRTDQQTQGFGGNWLKEDSALENGAMPESVYGWCKLVGEITARRLHKEYGFPVSVVRMFNVYGPREFPKLEECHVIPALIRKVLDGMNPLPVWGTGNAERSFLYAEDAAEGIMLCAERTNDGTPVNLGQPERLSIRNLAQMIVRLIGAKADIAFELTKPEGCFTRGPNVDRALALLGWTAKTSLEEGIKKTIDWNRQEMIKAGQKPVL